MSGASSRPVMGLMVALALLMSPACFERGKKDTEQREAAPVAVQKTTAASEALVTGLRSSEPEGQADPNAEITLRLAAEPLHLNPLLAGDRVATQITLGDVYEGLLLLDRPGMKAQPGLAKSYVRSTDGTRWTFYLRKGIRFHSGELLSTADVVRSFELARAAPGPLRADFDDLLGVRAESEDTVVFDFGETRPSRAEAFAAVPIVSTSSFRGVEASALARAEASRKPNGTGALRVLSWEQGRIELERFADYWGPAARAKRIVYQVIPDRQRALHALRSSQVHALLQLPVEEALEAYRESKGLALVRESFPAYTAAVFNTEKAALPPELRRALGQSFDRKGIIETLYRGHAQVALGPFVHESGRNDPALEPLRYDPGRLRQQLDKALPAEVDPSLTLLVPQGSRTMERLADIWASDLSGQLKVEVRALPFAEMLVEVRAGNFDVCLLSFTTSNDVDLFSLFHSSQVGSGNLSRLSDPAMDSLLDGMRRAHGEEEIQHLSREVHRLLRHLAPFAFLATDVRLGLVREELAGVGDSAAIWGARNLWIEQ